jgi:hypothetical protein
MFVTRLKFSYLFCASEFMFNEGVDGRLIMLFFRSFLSFSWFDFSTFASSYCVLSSMIMLSSFLPESVLRHLILFIWFCSALQRFGLF